MQKEISDYMKSHIEMLIEQTKAYQPFIKTAFPGLNLADASFNVIVGNAFSVFLGQFAMRMISPTEQDFAEFGHLYPSTEKKSTKFFPSL